MISTPSGITNPDETAEFYLKQTRKEGESLEQSQGLRWLNAWDSMVGTEKPQANRRTLT